ncbi:precorrin-6y C5,15-methyltransferase (decarboxylating) subunit CbiE [Paludisphaera mucosa]|uniref:Precorrin-6y C5,15-methyltransferase (Decarboxylating) subunit CbiE n=1 Tax=Paludisphaera mucosa TaxID=3030827 RepID=A0ABT6F5Z1_9BACT|nr:precorrin-6y C5,15-methyltransferase (decarboxylating) subunit CbiE [Paludisphaera mucosa]MDG3002979.1 precorrin-6y C5,15-methyltransferase (decarboxylating) subunit CbiE [Paludisphaera mucosa]
MTAEGRSKLVILGIGDDGTAGLTESARRILAEADLILGPASTLAQVGRVPGRKVILEAEMPAALEQVRASQSASRPVLVCGGDPLFYGVARYLCDRLGKDAFEVVPHVSSMQLAFARVKESWEDAYLTSLASRPIESVIDRIRTAEKAGLFSSDQHQPGKVARALLDHGVDYFRAYVCENLGSPDERVTQAELGELVGMDFSPLNVLILIRKAGGPDQVGRKGGRRLFGNPEDAFAEGRSATGLVTQAEVRAMALAQLDIRPTSVVWDVGAGSGSLAIEAAQLASLGAVYAIEPEAVDVALIRSNAEAFGTANVRAVAGRAPEALADLPDPDAVFIGGLGRQFDPLIEAAYGRLRAGGTLVVNVATLESLSSSYGAMKRLGEPVRVWNVMISRGVEQMETLRFDAIPPSFLLAVTKSGAGRG